mgnify:CR=1 FL=1
MGLYQVSIPEMVRLIEPGGTFVGNALRCFNSRDGAIDSFTEQDLR